MSQNLNQTNSAASKTMVLLGAALDELLFSMQKLPLPVSSTVSAHAPISALQMQQQNSIHLKTSSFSSDDKTKKQPHDATLEYDPEHPGLFAC